MNQSWKQSNTAKAMLILLTTVFCWGTLISAAGFAIEARLNLLSDSGDAGKAYVQSVMYQEEDNLTNYISAAVQTADTDSSTGYTLHYYNQDYSSSTSSRSIALRLFQEYYNTEETNLRFHATDNSGKVVLTNEDGPAERTEKLGSVNTTVWAKISERNYSVEHHFDDYRTLESTNMAELLDRESDFQIWYFTDDRVQEANENGLEITTPSDADSKYVWFDSAETANDFDFNEMFGEQASWTIVTGEEAENAFPDMIIGAQDADDPDDSAAPSGVIVRIDSYNSVDVEWVSLGEYADRKTSGEEIIAADEELEALLSAGFDVTVNGTAAEYEMFNVTVWVPTDMPAADTIRANYPAFRLLCGKAAWITAALFLFGIAAVLSAIAMCSAAGHAEGSTSIVIPTVHKLPYEFFWILPIAAFFAVVNSAYYLTDAVRYWSWRVPGLLGLGLLLCLAVLAVLWLYTTAIRIKSGTFWSSFGIVRLFRSIFSLFRHRTGSCIAAAAAATVLGIFNAVAFATRSVLIIPAIGLDLLALLFILYCMYSYFTLHQHLVQIEQGDFTPRRYLIPLAGDFLRFDTELNTLTDTVSTMVAEQIKAERMRTELITNVSHDLKTPLTSIVNYVDLLSREPMQSETAGEYLDVLRRQAARLKKLTTDLVDASKASTGNIAVEMQVTNVQVLLGQFSGEYDERLRERGLELVMHMPELPVCILADGRLSWRIFDNLLNNACKYAMSGTRIYLDVNAGEQEVCISMKNVSAAPLNISPDELMERFVRGDASRHTEGSGLGLSIARDLAALQGGTLTLSVDGDLFKASLQFPRYEEPPLLPDSVV